MQSHTLSLLLDEWLAKTAKPSLKYTEFPDGIVICADSTSIETFEFVKQYLKGKRVAAIVTDPPYIVGIKGLDGKAEKWDRIKQTQQQAVDWMFDWTKLWWPLLMDRGAFYCWGGTGTYKMHPFFLYLTQAEHREDMDMRLADTIVWKKRRAVGSPRKYLYVREELAYFLKSKNNDPRVFNKPYLEELRGYDGFGKYKAHSPYLRRGNVWTDITELFNNKYHSCQKPLKVMEIPIEVNTNKGEWVLDMFAGSGATGFAARNLGRKFILIESDPISYRNIVDRMRKFKPGDKLTRLM